MEVGTEKRRGRPPGSKKDAAGVDRGTNATAVDEESTGQKLMPGHERIADPEIEAQALKVYDLQTRRDKILKKEVEERALLTKMMRAANLTEYPLEEEGLVCEIDSDPKAKVHKAKKKRKDPEAG